MEITAAIELLRHEFEAEEQAGFPLLRPTPATSIQGFLRYYESLARPKRDLLKAAIAKHAVNLFVWSEDRIQLSKRESAAHAEWGNALSKRWSEYRNHPLKPLKWFVQHYHRQKALGLPVQTAEEIPEDIVRWVDGLSVCKAADLRKHLKPAFLQVGLRARNLGAGEWNYRSDADEVPFHVEIDFGGLPIYQFRYTVTRPWRDGGGMTPRFNYESLLASFAQGDGWDFVTEASAAKDATHLVKLVQRAATIGQEVENLLRPRSG